MLFLILYIIGHFFADYALQTEYMATAKNKWKPIDKTPWFWPMIAHCSIHGGFVFIVTSLFLFVFSTFPIVVILNISMVFSVIEIIFHFIIDCLKCKNLINYTMDQLLHVSCKILYYVVCLFLIMLFT